MRLAHRYPLLDFVRGMVIDLPTPSNISYLWNLGVTLGVVLVLQIASGLFLSMHYQASGDLAFDSVEHIMRDVNFGWFLRYLHANGASAFFIAMYLHIGRGLYFASYTHPRTLLWALGVAIFFLTMGTAFIGYVLPYGQMSFWGATVITNMVSAVPWVGQDLVLWIWGGYSVDHPTLNRFYSFHFLLPFVLLAVVLLHIIVLHETGSNNPLGLNANMDKLPFHPYFTFKDLLGLSLGVLGLLALVGWAPNLLGHTDNYIPGNPLVTPAHIVPEWYFLPFYAMLRAVPNKLLGVLTMVAGVLVLLVFPLNAAQASRGLFFNPLGKLGFWHFAAVFLILGWLGGAPAEGVYVLASQGFTLLYFGYALLPGLNYDPHRGWPSPPWCKGCMPHLG